MNAAFIIKVLIDGKKEEQFFGQGNENPLESVKRYCRESLKSSNLKIVAEERIDRVSVSEFSEDERAGWPKNIKTIPVFYFTIYR